MTKLWQFTASEIAAQTNSRTVSAIEVARSALERLHVVNPKLNAVVQHDDLWTLRQAQAVDERLARGELLPLAGVPITVKDNIWVEGQVITQGSLLFKDFVAPKDAWAVTR